ncbi:uncharacterized protein LOC144437914 [Glandiceps talaboti]
MTNLSAMTPEDVLPTTRVILWYHARSRSTVFELAIASDESIKIFHEEFVTAYYHGEERQSDMLIKNSEMGQVLKDYKYGDVRTRLEKSYPGKTVVFVKDAARELGGRDHYKYIPRGYINTFIVRNPRAAILSNYRSVKALHADIDKETWINLTKDNGSLIPIYQLYKYVTEDRRQRPVIIDSEDLANSPKETLQKYCQATGITFKESFLNWTPGNLENFPEPQRENPKLMAAYHENAVRSSCFQPSSDQHIDLSELPEELQKWSETNMPLYEEMIRQKL